MHIHFGESLIFIYVASKASYILVTCGNQIGTLHVFFFLHDMYIRIVYLFIFFGIIFSKIRSFFYCSSYRHFNQ